MARSNSKSIGLDVPKGIASNRHYAKGPDSDWFGQWTESFARAMGTPWFLIGMTIFCGVWLFWNSLAPEDLQFDPRALNFTLLTLILSLQASYAAPLLLLAQNRQDDRDRVTIEQDRQRAERNLADTEYLAREVVALRLALKDLPSKEFVREELRVLLAELDRSEKPDATEPGTADASVAAPPADTRPGANAHDDRVR